MPAIRIIPRLQDDNVCPPSRPFCRDTFFDVKDNPNLPPISDQTSTNSEEGQRSYAGLIVVLVIFAVSFILWLTWAKWPRTAVKALWKKISLKRKGGDGIHSPQLLKSAADEGTQSAMQEVCLHNIIFHSVSDDD